MAERSEKFYCRHCSSVAYNLQTIRSHLESNHDIASPGKPDYETDLERMARLRYEREQDEADQRRRDAIADFEVECAHEELAAIYGVDDFLRACGV